MTSSNVILENPPCFRSGLMWGISVGAIIGAHRFRTTRLIRQSCDGAILAFGLVGTGTWLFCTTSYRTRARQTREFMEMMNHPERKMEAEQFLQSRVYTRSEEDEEIK
ncbi:unnamed protein product [Peronospora belbahrii]|uniref:Cytochrome c oxidase assembly protein COX20, mitochondrial n=1 Tax=Peronospora belbahrii TaxID=622444 RepID=A0AAU9L0K4_9STRA|nr:unnamed protein product [Peronospora belbahrii]CAH0516127.1 unnamed protein product [Peronospora belbahrii]